MDFIRKYKGGFRAAVVIGATLSAYIILSLKYRQTRTSDMFDVELLAIATLIFFVGFFPLCYESWFKGKMKASIYYFEQIIFWAFLLGAIVVSVSIGNILYGIS